MYLEANKTAEPVTNVAQKDILPVIARRTMLLLSKPMIKLLKIKCSLVTHYAMMI